MTCEKPKNEIVGKILRWVVGVLIIAIFATLILLMSGATLDFWGSRGVVDLYRFQYNGKPAAVQQDNRILSDDKYWILVSGGGKIYDGTLVGDDKKRVSIGARGNLYEGHWSVRETE